MMKPFPDRDFAPLSKSNEYQDYSRKHQSEHRQCLTSLPCDFPSVWCLRPQPQVEPRGRTLCHGGSCHSPMHGVEGYVSINWDTHWFWRLTVQAPFAKLGSIGPTE